MLGGEVHVGQHVGLAVVDERTELRPLVAELVSDVAHGLAGVLVVQLGERLAQGGRDHVLLAFGHIPNLALPTERPRITDKPPRGAPYPSAEYRG